MSLFGKCVKERFFCMCMMFLRLRHPNFKCVNILFRLVWIDNEGGAFVIVGDWEEDGMLGEKCDGERGECVGGVGKGEATSDDDATLGGDFTDITEGGIIGEVSWF